MEPVMKVLRMGSRPEELAWSVALGLVIGINPVVGSTTLIATAVILSLRLNIVAGLLANQVMYPVELALVVPFIHAGERLFRQPQTEVLNRQMLAQMHTSPWVTIRTLWGWEWHALVAWGLCAVVLTPMLAWVLKPVIRRFAEKRAEKAAVPAGE